MGNDRNAPHTPQKVLTQEQEELLEVYITKLDNYFEELRQAEKTQVAIETQHLKRVLSK